MSELEIVLVYAVVVAVLLVGGVWIGMLIAPRLGRLTEPPSDVDDEGPGDDD